MLLNLSRLFSARFIFDLNFGEFFIMKKAIVLFALTFCSAAAFALAAKDPDCMYKCGYAGVPKSSCDRICTTP